MTLDQVRHYFDRNSVQWTLTPGQPCVHTFYGDYCIVFCHNVSESENKVLIDVDNIATGGKFDSCREYIA